MIEIMGNLYDYNGPPITENPGQLLEDFGFAALPPPENYGRTTEERSKEFKKTQADYELFSKFQYDAPIANMPRPGYYTGGKPINMEINCFKVEFMPNQKVYQYDVS